MVYLQTEEKKNPLSIHLIFIPTAFSNTRVLKNSWLCYAVELDFSSNSQQNGMLRENDVAFEKNKSHNLKGHHEMNGYIPWMI